MLRDNVTVRRTTNAANASPKEKWFLPSGHEDSVQVLKEPTSATAQDFAVGVRSPLQNACNIPTLFAARFAGNAFSDTRHGVAIKVFDLSRSQHCEEVSMSRIQTRPAG